MPERNCTHPTTGILLAAGQGARFGGDKCLAPLPDGSAMGLRSALNLAEAVERLICVVRAEDQMLQNLFLQNGFEVAVCVDAETGMSASIRAGIEAATLLGTNYLLALADMPLIKPTTCRCIAHALQQYGGIVVPVHNGQRGHPVGFSAAYRGALLQLTGDQGARLLLSKFADDVTVIPVADPGIYQDFDTPAELEQLHTMPD